MTKKVYGLSNCDSTKATIKWLKANNIAFQLHDLKTDGITEEQLKEWLKLVPMEKILNKKSTTWRSLSLPQQKMADDTTTAIRLIIENTSLIKRPVIEEAGVLQSIGIIPGPTKK